MKKRVYDIFNAGPRHRFTCNGKIVSNCGRLLQTQNLPRPAGWSNVIDPVPGEKEYRITQADVDLASCGNPDLPLMWFKDANVLAADCIRAMIKAKDGRELIIADFSAVEARALSYLAGEEPDLIAYRQGKDIYKVTAAMIYGITYEEVDGGGKGAQRQVGKTALLACLAKETNVLTKRGVVPIENVRKGDKVWDGENWVFTDGAIFRGNKECIYVNGVWATPDHKWFLDGERWVDTVYFLSVKEKLTKPQLEMTRLPTYDLLNCGPYNRFAVFTTKGIEIVHNCGYSGGISSLKKFGYDKMPISEEDALHAIEVMEDTIRPEDLEDVYRYLKLPSNLTGDTLKAAVKEAYYNPEYHSTAEDILKEVKGKWIVKQWRVNHPKTVQFWYDMKNASIEAVENPGARVPCGKFVFKRIGRFLVMRLPSGRNLYYLDPIVEVLETPWGTKNKVVTSLSQDSVTKKMERRSLNISILVENAVQAFCRDLLAESMLRLRDKLGVDIVMHIHDECVAEVKEGSVSIEDYIRVMSETPEWAEGMPLIAAGDIAPMYHK